MFDLQPVLSQDGDEPGDYTLNANSCWITVGCLAVYIQRMDDGVAVDICPQGHEDEQTIASAYACFADGHRQRT